MYRNKCNLRHQTFLLALSLLVIGLAGCGGGSSNPSAPMPPVSFETLDKSVKASLAANKVPAIAAAVIDSNTIVTSVEGIRKVGSPDKVQSNDRFHLGSNGKAMTTTLIATYVEEGKIAWTTRLIDVFPEFASVMRPELRDVTVQMLLELRGGMTPLETLDEIQAVPLFTGTGAEQRRTFTKWAVQQPADSAPGDYRYSNTCYSVAAAMLEKVIGKSWEQMMFDRVYHPLGITTAGLGWPASNGAKQPWGHILNDDKTLSPHNPDNPAEQFPKYLEPAGDIMMSIEDYAKFVQMNLRGLRGQQTLLHAATIQKIHTPAPGGFYALGWAVTSINGVQTSYYFGSAGTFFADVQLQSSKNRAVTAITNCPDDLAYTATEAVTMPLLGSSTPVGANSVRAKSLLSH